MKHIVLFSALVIGLSGCSWIPWHQKADTAHNDGQVITGDFNRSRLIAQDLANAMAQIPQLDPASVTLYSTRPQSRFGELLLIALQSNNFDLRMGANDSPNLLNYNVFKEPTPAASGNAVYTFLVAAGNVKLKRSYEVDGLGVQPASTLYVLGADASAIELDDSIFTSVPALQPVPAPKNSADKAATAMVVRVQPVPVKDSFEPKPITSTAFAIDVNKKKQNIYDTRRSNFASELAEFETVRREVMIFPNDSLVMGPRNKRMARTMLGQFDDKTDVISIIGCSHGNTALDNGNEVLANGRATRVKEEFVLAGVDANKLLDEGCWASIHFNDNLPRRGVVVTHKRLAN